MDRIWESGASASPPTAPASPSSGYPIAGNPAAGTPATTPGPWWYHMVTEEMRAVIAAAGLTPDHTNLGQLLAALQNMGLRDATDALKGVVELATNDEVLAGTDAVRAVTPAGLLGGLLGAGGVGTSDYIKIPFRDKTSGARRDLIVQWGKTTTTSFVNASDLSAGVTFPIAFPNAALFAGGLAIAYSMTPSVRSYGVLFRITNGGPSPTTLSCALWNPANNYQNGDSCQFFWYAIGY